MSALLLLAAYVLPNCWFYYHDSVYYQAVILKGSLSDQLHPHHLLLTPLLGMLYELATSLGYRGTPLDVWQPLSILGGWLALWSVYQPLKWLLHEDQYARIAQCTLAVTWYWWFFSVSPTHYTLVLPFLMLIWQEMTFWPVNDCLEASERRVAGYWTIAVLLHQVAVLVLPVLAGWRWYLARQRNIPADWPRLGARLLLPVTAIYAVCALAVSGSTWPPMDAISWLTHYGHNPENWIWGHRQADVPLFGTWINLTLDSHRHLLWAHPYASAPELKANMEVVGASAPVASVWWTLVNPHWNLVTSVLLWLLLTWLVLAINAIRVDDSEDRDLAILALLWCAPFVLFHCFYRPQDGWFRLYYLAPLTGLMFLPLVRAAATPWHGVGRALIGGFLAFTLVNNIANGYTIWRHPEANRWRWEVSQIADLDGWLVFGEPGFDVTDVDYARAFTDRIVFQGELVLTKGEPSDGEWPAYLYVDAEVSDQIEAAAPDRILHLGWAMATQSIQEAWIPVASLDKETRAESGIYGLTRYRVHSKRPQEESNLH